LAIVRQQSPLAIAEALENQPASEQESEAHSSEDFLEGCGLVETWLPRLGAARRQGKEEL
jgi:hypothetical protein